MLRVEAGTSLVVELGGLRATVARTADGLLVLDGLEGEGTIEEFQAAADEIRGRLGGETVYVAVRLDHPRYAALIRLYSGLGAVAELTMMRWN